MLIPSWIDNIGRFFLFMILLWGGGKCPSSWATAPSYTSTAYDQWLLTLILEKVEEDTYLTEKEKEKLKELLQGPKDLGEKKAKRKWKSLKELEDMLSFRGPKNSHIRTFFSVLLFILLPLFVLAFQLHGGVTWENNNKRITTIVSLLVGFYVMEWSAYAWKGSSLLLFLTRMVDQNHFSLYQKWMKNHHLDLYSLYHAPHTLPSITSQRIFEEIDNWMKEERPQRYKNLGAVPLRNLEEIYWSEPSHALDREIHLSSKVRDLKKIYHWFKEKGVPTALNQPVKCVDQPPSLYALCEKNYERDRLKEKIEESKEEKEKMDRLISLLPSLEAFSLAYGKYQERKRKDKEKLESEGTDSFSSYFHFSLTTMLIIGALDFMIRWHLKGKGYQVWDFWLNAWLQWEVAFLFTRMTYLKIKEDHQQYLRPDFFKTIALAVDGNASWWPYECFFVGCFLLSFLSLGILPYFLSKSYGIQVNDSKNLRNGQYLLFDLFCWGTWGEASYNKRQLAFPVIIFFAIMAICVYLWERFLFPSLRKALDHWPTMVRLADHLQQRGKACQEHIFVELDTWLKKKKGGLNLSDCGIHSVEQLNDWLNQDASLRSSEEEELLIYIKHIFAWPVKKKQRLHPRFSTPIKEEKKETAISAPKEDIPPSVPDQGMNKLAWAMVLVGILLLLILLGNALLKRSRREDAVD